MTQQNNSRKEEGNAVHCLEAQWILFNHVEIEKDLSVKFMMTLKLR